MLKHLVKNFNIKKIIKRHKPMFVAPSVTYSFERVGVLVDGNRFDNKTLIIDKLREYQLGNVEIMFLIYKNKKTKDVEQSEYFSSVDFGLSGEVKNTDVQFFCDYEFDLLISYYDNNISYLNLINCLSKAKFKVGFTAIKSKFNQLDINVAIDDCEVFFTELDKYLTIIKNK
jgi:hypothetical protein